MAGLDNKSSEILEIENLKETNNIFKEDFNNFIPSKYDSRIDFMQEILKEFSLETAVHKNKSINYFLNKIDKQK